LPPAASETLRAALDAAATLPSRWAAEPPSPSKASAALRALPLEALAYLHAAITNPEFRALLDRYNPDWRHVRLEITGTDLIAAGIPPGPALGAALRATLDAKIEGRIAAKDAELAFALAWLKRDPPVQ